MTGNGEKRKASSTELSEGGYIPSDEKAVCSRGEDMSEGEVLMVGVRVKKRLRRARPLVVTIMRNS